PQGPAGRGDGSPPAHGPALALGHRDLSRRGGGPRAGQGPGRQVGGSAGRRRAAAPRRGAGGPADQGPGPPVRRGRADRTAVAGRDLPDLLRERRGQPKRGSAMTATFLHALRRQRWALLGWGLALFALALAVLQAYTAFAADAAEM